MTNIYLVCYYTFGNIEPTHNNKVNDVRRHSVHSRHLRHRSCCCCCHRCSHQVQAGEKKSELTRLRLERRVSFYITTSQIQHTNKLKFVSMLSIKIASLFVFFIPDSLFRARPIQHYWLYPRRFSRDANHILVYLSKLFISGIVMVYSC